MSYQGHGQLCILVEGAPGYHWRKKGKDLIFVDSFSGCDDVMMPKATIQYHQSAKPILFNIKQYHHKTGNTAPFLTDGETET
jgi:hypothetical protein